MQGGPGCGQDQEGARRQQAGELAMRLHLGCLLSVTRVRTTRQPSVASNPISTSAASTAVTWTNTGLGGRGAGRCLVLFLVMCGQRTGKSSSSGRWLGRHGHCRDVCPVVDAGVCLGEDGEEAVATGGESFVVAD